MRVLILILLIIALKVYSSTIRGEPFPKPNKKLQDDFKTKKKDGERSNSNKQKIKNITKFQPSPPSIKTLADEKILSKLELELMLISWWSRVVSVSWTQPAGWRQSPDHVLVIEFLKAGSDESPSDTEDDNPYGDDKSNHLIIKREFDKGRNGVIKVKINRKLAKYKNVSKLRVKVVNQDYETSKYSREVQLPDVEKTMNDYNDEDYKFLFREVRPMGILA